MDVTISPGAPRAGEPAIRPRPTGRAAGPDFETFLRPAVERPTAGEGSRAERPDAIDRRDDTAERDVARRQDERRAAERREAERREADAAAARAAERREADEAAANERAERRAAETAAAREAGERRAAEAEAHEAAERRADDAAARDAETAASLPDDPVNADDRVADDSSPAPRRRADDTLPAGALGLTGLIERLAADPRFAGARFAAAAARPLDAPAPDATRDGIIDGAADHIGDAMADANTDGMTDAAADADPALDGAPLDLALLDRADPSEALARALGPRRLAPDTVRLGPRLPGDPADPRAGAPSLLAAPTRPAEAAAVARAPLGRAALPPGVDESAVLRQVSDALRATGDRNRTAEIALHPAELGRVRLRITMHDGVARVVVGAEQPAVVDLLASGLDELRRDLMAHGLQVGHLEVEAQLSRDPHGRHEAPERDDAEAPERPAPKASTPRRMVRGLIDIEA